MMKKIKVYYSNFYGNRKFVNHNGSKVIESTDMDGKHVIISASAKFWNGSEESLKEYLNKMWQYDEHGLEFRYNTKVTLLDKTVMYQGRYDRCWYCGDFGIELEDHEPYCPKCHAANDPDDEIAVPDQDIYAWEEDILEDAGL
jgi:hypothetical protein